MIASKFIFILLIFNCIYWVSSTRLGITGMIGDKEELDLIDKNTQDEIKPIVQFALNKLIAYKKFRDGSFKLFEVIKETLYHTFDGKLYLKSVRSQSKLVMGYYYHIIHKGLTVVNDKRKNYIFNVTVWRDLDKRMNMVKNIHYQTTLEPPKTKKRNLKVLTYNIWNFNEPWNVRLKKITSEVLKMNPDIVAFQEVRYRFLDTFNLRGTFQVEQIAEKLGKKYQYYYQHSMTYLNQRYFHEDEGHAIFSLHPIRETDFIRLSRDLDDGEDDHQRIVATALVETPIGLVNMHSSHLSLSERARRRTVVEIWDYIRKKNENQRIPQIFVGDMNGEPNDILYKFLTGGEKINSEKASMIDSWSQVNPNSLGLTFPTNHPIKRIDFVFYLGSINAIKAKVEGKVASNLEWSSDHLPLIVTFVKDD